MGKKAVKAKTSSKKKANNNRYITVGLAVFGLIALIIGGVFAYKTIRYNSAPEEIKLIRILPIYNYESDDLKIVSRSEDYGGTDWKGVYNEPTVYLRLGTTTYKYSYNYCKVELTSFFSRLGWERSDISMIGEGYGILAFKKTVDNQNLMVTISPSDFENQVCRVTVKSI